MTTRPIRLVAFDLDGVIYRGGLLLPRAVEATEDILRRRLSLRYVTNNATMHRSGLAERLAGFGLPVSEDEVLSSAAATAFWLSRHLPAGSGVLCVGEGGLLREIHDVGLEPHHALEDGVAALTEAGRFAAVVVGLDRSFTYASLAAAQAAIFAGATFVATNPDSTFPAEGRLLPGGGSLVAAVEKAAGREPILIGKPSLELAHALIEAAEVEPGEILMIGDRLDTDVAWAKEAGMQAALVLTGVARREDLGAGAPVPDWVLEDLSELPPLLDEIAAG